MRLVAVTLAVIFVASFVSTPAVANSNQLAANICNYVKSDDKNRLRKKLKESRVKLRNIYSGISCDGSSLLRTAYNSNANNIGEFIAKRLSSKELSATEADGNTIIDWANANGHGGNAITAVINDRLGGS
ncbi:DUF3718 domain-containing protein [Shewanella intestini]|uniref:DUF3718 domain-containing protein n=1 Tax=Shewanella intestini TaxID=2017544 RepID=A0ABS5HYB4_9GAMM|nr:MULTISPECIES: DUF3718 domain-containing protein [Shewanella]MBR9726404.1 DUF3718 domain-containing protein [Shewanella intestini]MRG35030.1 DUF3718 domain-containing protein [Shewanella sp. XMDDZSB0408]